MTTTIDPFYRGDTVYLAIEVTKGGVAQPLTDAILWFTVKENLGDADEDALIAVDSTDGGITFTDVVEGKAQAKLSPAETATLSPGMYTWDVQLKTPDDEDITTVAAGTLTVLPDITRRTT